MFVKRIKRFFGLFWQVLLLPGLFIPYYILLDSVIVDWLVRNPAGKREPATVRGAACV